MTPGEEEIMMIYEDGIYRPPDMIERSRDIIILICRSHHESPPYSAVNLIKGFHHTHL
jgi:hypothetical protein